MSHNFVAGRPPRNCLLIKYKKPYLWPKYKDFVQTAPVSTKNQRIIGSISKYTSKKTRNWFLKLHFAIQQILDHPSRLYPTSRNPSLSHPSRACFEIHGREPRLHLHITLALFGNVHVVPSREGNGHVSVGGEEHDVHSFGIPRWDLFRTLLLATQQPLDRSVKQEAACIWT